MGGDQHPSPNSQGEEFMPNRRQFVGAAASAGLLAQAGTAFGAAAPRYDLIIKGGRVIDTSTRIDGVRDVAILNGRIAAVEANIAADAAQTIDARNRIVMAGM